MLPFMVSCWGITLDAKTPSGYTESVKVIESYHGSSQKEILKEFGEPDWKVERDSSTFYIYQWKSSDKDIVFFVIPIPVAGGKSNAYIYCLLLEFDENDKLIKHDMRETIDTDVHVWGIDRFEDDCMDLYPFGASKSEWSLQKEIGTNCPNAELGHADAQKRIGDLYYLGAYGIGVDYTKAYLWYSLSSDGGNYSATEQLLLIEDRLSADELTEAQNQVDAWVPGQCRTDLLNAVEDAYK
jgi:hypothetical protein